MQSRGSLWLSLDTTPRLDTSRFGTVRCCSATNDFFSCSAGLDLWGAMRYVDARKQGGGHAPLYWPGGMPSGHWQTQEGYLCRRALHFRYGTPYCTQTL